MGIGGILMKTIMEHDSSATASRVLLEAWESACLLMQISDWWKKAKMKADARANVVGGACATKASPPCAVFDILSPISVRQSNPKINTPIICHSLLSISTCLKKRFWLSIFV